MMMVVVMLRRVISFLAQTPLLSFKLMQHWCKTAGVEPNCLGSNPEFTTY